MTGNMLFLDSLVSALWGGGDHLSATKRLSHPPASEMPPASPLEEVTVVPSAPTTPATPTSPQKHAARHSAELPPLKKSRRSEPLEAEVAPNHVEASLNIFPFTLQNMAKKYVQDMKWQVEFGGATWSFYIHVLSSDREENSVALVGLKVQGPSQPSGQHTPEHRDDSSGQVLALSPLAFASSSSSSSSASKPRSGNFEVSWKVISHGPDQAVLATSPPAQHTVEPGDSYIIEFANEEFDFTSSLRDGLRLQVLIRDLTEEDDDIFYDSEEDESNHHSHDRDPSLEEPWIPASRHLL